MKTGHEVYAQQPLPLPLLGEKIIDPIFDAEIMRVTDENDGAALGTFYSYWPTFNKNNTLFLVGDLIPNTAFIREFDPVAFKLGSKKVIPPIPELGYLPKLDSATWSAIDPNILFCTADSKIYEYHVNTAVYELIANLDSQLPTTFAYQLSVKDDNRFAFHKKLYVGYAAVGCVVYDRAQNRIVANIDNPEVDEVTISKDGKFLLIKTGSQGADAVESIVLEVDTGKQTPLLDDKDFAPGHGDAGVDCYVGYDNWRNQINWRAFSKPKHDEVRTLLQLPNWTLGANHTSMLADDENWLLISFFGGSASAADAGVFRNEVIQVATDGSQKVRRLFHHRSIYSHYYDSPRANISRDGQFVAFTSNWGGTRLDLFIARIQPNPVPAPPPPQPPPSAEYITETFGLGTEKARTDLYHRMFSQGYAAWDEMVGHKIRFKKF